MSNLTMSYLVLIAALYELFHSLRNLFQYLGKTNIFTKVPGHALGIKITNFFLKPFGLKYSVNQEVYYFVFELVISILLFVLFFHLINSKK